MLIREMNILIIAEFFILNHVSYVLSRGLNLTQLLIKSLDPDLVYQKALRNIPMERDFYLEEYYDAESEARELRQLNRDNRNLFAEYRSLCETITKRVDLDSDDEYEYQPLHYHEVYCKAYSLMSEEERMIKPLEQKCVYPVFHCVQRYRSLSFVRRHWDSQCWEPYTKEIASGCDCMWPVASFGEIKEHY